MTWNKTVFLNSKKYHRITAGVQREPEAEQSGAAGSHRIT